MKNKEKSDLNVKEKKDKSLVATKNKKKRGNGFFKEMSELLGKRWLVNGSTTLLLVLIIFSIYIGVTGLLDKVTMPEIDFTSEKIYSLSDETKNKVSELEKDVKITLVNYGEDSSTEDTVKKYETLSKKLTIETIDDLSARADIAQKYSLTSDDTLIIVSCGDKETTLSADDLVTYDYTTYEQVDRTEEAITNAIVDVITEKKPVIYFMSNHLMYATSYYNSLMQSFKDDANEVEMIDIFAKGSIPENCDTLVITSLKEDITELERDTLIGYIKNGGKIMLLTASNMEEITFPNFETVLSEYGIKIENGVIFEGNTSNMLSGYPDIMVEEVSNNSITKNVNMNLGACIVDASPITKTVDEEKLDSLGVTYEDLIKTSELAFVRTNLNITSASRTSSDSEEKSFTVGLLANKKVENDKTSKIIVYSTEFIGMDRAIKLGNYSYNIIDLYNNQDIVSNSIAYLNEREDTITIRKNYDTVKYTATQNQHNIVLAVIFGVPVIIIIIGIVVWIIRRKRNK